MDTAALKTFAQDARRQLLAAVTGKLSAVLAARTPDYLATFAPQVAKLRLMAEQDRSGLIERVAYTWFNRLAALRFMDARGWHPFHARVLTAVNPSETQPELLKLTRTGALPEELRLHTDPARLNDLLDGRIPSPDAQGEVYRHLVLAACHFYHDLLPDLFEKLDDETELLLPDDLLTTHSVVQSFRTEIRDEHCGDGERANVELLGWLYQFYISERKDQVMARKSAVPTEDIPAVTQLFTPHWIVRYLVENSLGRLWLLNRPGSKLREHMPYYIEGEPETEFLKISTPEELRVLDPAVGSGHMLTYAFDLLTHIYEEEGYASTEIPSLILQHNLHGLDICGRAAQLAELAIVFKARDESRRFFQPEHLVRPHILELRDVRFAENELRDYIHALGLGDLFSQPMLKLLHQFEEAKNFGSLIQPCLDERTIAFARCAVEAKDLGGQLFLRETHLKVLRVLEQAEALTQRYHVVVANPPYMGSGAMNPRLKDFVEAHWEDGRSDSYAAFMVRNVAMTLPSGHIAMITIPNWMFLKGFEGLRKMFVGQTDFTSLVHCGRGIWGSDFGSCAFVVKAGRSLGFRGTFKRLFKKQGEVQSIDDIEVNFFNVDDFPNYLARSSEFSLIPGCPIVYWLSPRWRACFGKQTFGDHLLSEGAVKTGNNAKFIRYTWEIGSLSVGADLPWRKHPKGGPFRRWFGNLEHVVDWSVQARKHYRDDHIARIPVDSIWNMTGITWTAVSIGELSFRFKSEDEIANNAALFVYAKRPEYLLAHLCCLNSCVTRHFLSAISPAVNFLVGDVLAIPFPSRHDFLTVAPRIGEQALAWSRADWDNFETSWGFRDQPLLRPGLKGATLEASWRNWEAQNTLAIRRMQELETENNRLFISAYGLDGELQPEVPEEQITLARADARRDVAAFLSYAVGCIMGRYGLDQPGLVLANAGDTLSEFLAKVGRPQDQLTFVPDEDGLIPVLDGEWFEDDIVARTREFLRATFGEASLRENVRFIEESLGKDLRKYFLADFYRDHLQTYKKRPIYWMIQSPRKGFSVLVYLHRYTRDTMNLVLNRYLREFQAKTRNRLSHLAEEQAHSISAREKTTARKEAEKLTKVIHECEEWERQTLLPLAQARIDLNLDDGVKVNYLKLGEALAPIPGLATVEE